VTGADECEGLIDCLVSTYWMTNDLYVCSSNALSRQRFGVANACTFNNLCLYATYQ
jgi:hypothetical protein